MDKRLVLKALRSIAYYLSNKEKRYALLLIILLILSSILDVFGLASLVPVIMAASTPNFVQSNEYFNAVFQFLNFQSEKMFLLFLIGCIFIFFLLKNLFIIWISSRQVRFTASVALKIVRREFDKYCTLPFSVFNTIGSANLINSVLSTPQYFVLGVIRPIFVFFSELVIISVIAIGIFLYQPILIAILLFVLTPSALLTYSLLKKRSSRIGEKLLKLRPIPHRILINIFNGFVEIKLANKLGAFEQRFLSNQKEVQEMEEKSYLYSQIPLKIIEMVAILGVVVIFAYSLLFSPSNTNIISIIGLFAAATYRLMPSINRLLTSLITIKQNENLIDALSLYREYHLSSSKVKVNGPIKFEKVIEFSNLSFTFPGASNPALSNINISVKKGEKVGFIGASGSGKTTLMNVFLRFYEEQEGKILIDGVPLNMSNKEAWYSIVGYVKQDTYLMEGSIKDNITLMDEEVDEKRLNYAIENASLKDFIETLPDGYNTSIGEKGARLSGGQKQRIGIARALYKSSQILILDEATSALDTMTEREVADAISKLSETDITIFIIAHRITTLRDCNRIYEVNNGKIVAERSYQDVLNTVIS